ncbi:DUF3102 domain-containing protein [Calycomorphotria hydatis]|uniref:DUF3102 domain-containing protein n=1 Tax=Calycomorphotria hydatis TaxID=2528027 RepID=A0A517TDB9_9PLAN|nr:DUF3102 domain-containing protein [Calycomorphotria hydatis]QDT66364.1 hypothetical protein V22_36300 [Calycomorphotria hydatis]
MEKRLRSRISRLKTAENAIKLASELRDEYLSLIRNAQTDAFVKYARAIGQSLTKAKELHNHGDWLPYLSEKGWSERQAQRYMQIADNWDELAKAGKHEGTMKEALDYLKKSNTDTNEPNGGEQENLTKEEWEQRISLKQLSLRFEIKADDKEFEESIGEIDRLKLNGLLAERMKPVIAKLLKEARANRDAA